MTKSANNMENEIRRMFLDEFGGIIKGLSTPEEMADLMLEYVINKNGLINIDYENVQNTLRGMTEGDGMLVKADKQKLEQVLEESRTGLTAAHPDMKLKSFLLQIVMPQQFGLMMDEMQVFYNFFNSLGEEVQVSWGIVSDEAACDDCMFFIMAGFTD